MSDGKKLYKISKQYAQDVFDGKIEDDSWNEILWLDEHGFIDEEAVERNYEDVQG